MAEKNKSIPIRTDAILKENAAYNRYYMTVSSRYCAAKWITLLVFTVYLVGMLVAGRSSITYENFLYLMRDFNLSSSAHGGYSSIVYEEQQNMSFSVYKNALAVAGASGVRLFDASGNTVLKDTVAYKTPVLLTGDKYMILYDEGGREFSILTTLARVSGGTAEGDILCCAVGDNGTYAVAHRNPEAKFAVDIYDSSFRHVERIFRESYVTGLALDKSGDYVAVLTSRFDNWNVSSEVSILRVGEEEMRSVSLGSRLPIFCRYLKNGNLAIVCDTAVVILSENGSTVTDIPLGSMTLAKFHVSDHLIALVCSENVLGNENRIVVYNAVGNAMFTSVLDGKISGVIASDVYDCVYISRDSSIERISADEKQDVQFSGNMIQVCEINGRVLLCFPGSAFAVDFEN